MARFIEGRSTGDLLLLLIAGTICFAVIAGGATVALVEILHPDADTSSAQNSISDVINTLIGLLAGFLAGRTDVAKVRYEAIHGPNGDQQPDEAEAVPPRRPL